MFKTSELKIQLHPAGVKFADILQKVMRILLEINRVLYINLSKIRITLKIALK